jgi:superfamily II DNA/RNA helicase
MGERWDAFLTQLLRAEDIEKIIEGTPATRQTALFSATLPARILKIAARHLRTPERVTISPTRSSRRSGQEHSAARK